MRSSIFLCFLLSLAACQSEAQSKLEPGAFEQALQKDQSAQLIDVRTPEEYRSGHIAGAVNINYYDSDFAQKIEKLDKNRPVMVYCAVGGRSGKAAAQFKQLGFGKVTDLSGGIKAWQAAGKPLAQ
jgi:rhodanese-related sulfurtransferase